MSFPQKAIDAAQTWLHKNADRLVLAVPEDWTDASVAALKHTLAKGVMVAPDTGAMF